MIRQLAARLEPGRRFVVEAVVERVDLLGRKVVEPARCEMRIRSAAVGKLLIAKLEFWRGARPEWSFEKLVDHACWELDCNAHAQARRRFRRALLPALEKL
jgi:hypothetical protein